jgi:hypothetical protein
MLKYNIFSFIFNFSLVCEPRSQKPQEALNIIVTEEFYWALFYIFNLSVCILLRVLD